LLHLEVIKPYGMVELHNLAPSVIYIGQHPDNNIVIKGAGIDDWHLVLDCRQKPYQVIMLSNLGNTAIDGQTLPSNTPIHLPPSASLQVADYELILLEDSPFGQQDPLPAPLSGVIINEPKPEIFSPSPPAVVNESPSPPQPDIAPPTYSDWSPPQAEPTWENDISTSRHNGRGDYSNHENFMVELSGFPDEADRKLQVDVNREVAFNVIIFNTGNRQTDFVLKIYTDVPYSINPKVGQILQGEKQTVTISLKPEKDPSQSSSRAGEHPITVEVTATEYRDSVSQFSVTLIVNPYHDFAVGELNPKQQKISWFKAHSETRVTITNKGNSATNFQLKGHDDVRGCVYEFYDVPGESVALAGQASLDLPPESLVPQQSKPDHVVEIPVRIIPHTYPIFLRTSIYRFTITVTPTGGDQISRSLSGEVKQKPLFSWYTLFPLLVLMVCLCASLSIYLTRPYITTFTINGEIKKPYIIDAGEEITLGWSASPLANLKVNPDVGVLDASSGSLTIKPEIDTVYELTSENLLSSIFPGLSNTKEVTVQVDPIYPEIGNFEVSPESIVSGEKGTLAWAVENADELILTINGAPETIPTTEYITQRSVSPNEDTVFSLEARNFYGIDQKSAQIVVSTPTGTPIPPPVVEFFNVNPNQILAGESITLNWSVTGADSVEINPLGPVPSQGPISHSPQDTTLYTLLVVKQGAPSISLIKEVVVNVPTGTPTATATPAAPNIIEFKAAKDTLLTGSDSEDENDTLVTLFWTVAGETTDIQIANKDNNIIQSNLDKASQIEVPIDEESTLFTLIAKNGDKENRLSVTLNIETATPTATPLPTGTPLPTPLPDAQIDFFRAGAGSNTPTDNVQLISGIRYSVVAGSEVILSWSTQNADGVTLFDGASSLGNFEFGGNIIIGDITTGKNYELRATNSEDKTTSSHIQLEITANTADPPFNFNEIQVSQSVGPNYEFTWSYLNEGDILGFRIYRASNDSSNYIRTTELGPGIRTWIDPTAATSCDKFYMVAFYLNLVTDNIEETIAGDPSWNSPGC